mgnify:CR=1 FL=1
MKDSLLSLQLPKPAPGPRVTEIDGPGALPEQLFPCLNPQAHEALLLSGGDHPLSRHSFIGLDPFLVVRAYAKRVHLDSLPEGKRRTLFADPFDLLRSLLTTYRQEPRADLPPFWSGGVGYLSYEMGRHLERLPSTTVDDLGLPECYLVFYRSILSYDHERSVYALFTLEFPGEEAATKGSSREETRRRIQEGVDALAAYGEIFHRNVEASGVVPQISCIMGPCAGGAVYSPALTDFVFMTSHTSYMFVTGPNVVKEVLNEDVTSEQLGGAEIHARKSGVAHMIYDDEENTILALKKFLACLPSNNVENPPYIPPTDDPLRMDEELNNIVPLDPAAPYNMHDVINRVVDRDSFIELQPLWARNAITGLARIGGHSVGIVAQEPSIMAGVIDIDASDKMARFVRMCDCFNIPLVTFVDSPGYLPGIDQEHRGTIRHGAKWSG